VAQAIGRNRRFHGGLIAHLGVAVAAVAVTASSTFGAQREVTLDRGETVSFAGYVARYEGARFLEQPHRDVVVTDLAFSRNGAAVGVATPSLNLYPAASEPIGTPSVDYGVIRDLYVSVLGFEGRGQRATFRLFLNPGVTWLWVGGVLVAVGGLIAALPDRRRRGAEPSRTRQDALVEVGG
jgi:cytochrome c-type biogenesis protein CcmF